MKTEPERVDATRPPVSEEANGDVMIGEFIARWDAASDGVMMDADTAQALAREFKRMRGLIYVPGVWRCAKCGFRVVQSSLNAHDGTVTARNEPGEKCPNDGAPLWRVTYRDDVAEAYDRWEEQVNRAVEAEKKLAAFEQRIRGEGVGDVWPADAQFQPGDLVQKKGRASWRGKVVGWYRTDITALGYAVESIYETGSVQIYPETALGALSTPAAELVGIKQLREALASYQAGECSKTQFADNMIAALRSPEHKEPEK